MNKELQVLADWLRANKLSLNISKTFISLTVRFSNFVLCKGPLIWNRIPFVIQQKKFLQYHKKQFCKRILWRASWSVFNVKYLFIYICNEILVVVGSWYYYTFAIHVNCIFVIEYYRYVLYTWSVIKTISICYTWNYYYNIIVYTVLVGLAATSLIYEKWFHNNNYYLYHLVTSIIGSAVCPESCIIWLIVTFLV